MDKITKPNDILVATLKAPEATTLDLLKNNINSDNTSLLTPEEYKQTPLVLKAFTENGVFNEDLFNKAYALAYNKYTELIDKDLQDNLEKELEYGEKSIYRPLDAKIHDKDYSLTTLRNPLQKSYSLSGINEISEPKLTEEEAAQDNFIFDPKTNKFLSDTPTSRSLLKRAFGETLVYAKYDKSDFYINPETGEKEWHEKGEWKTDKNGNYYTEILGDRELLDKQVVSFGDILTKEDSWLNKIDFFDSDGYDKSGWGIAFKTAFAIAPYLIPGVNTYAGAVSAALGLASVMPTLYKSIESIFTGENNSDLYKSMTSAENWFKKFSPSTSRKGRESFWTVEQLAQMSSDVFSQLYQQRAAASLTQLIKKPKFKTLGEELDFYKKQNKLGSALSLGYMALTSAADVYNEALVSGYNKRTAGITSLLSASALYGIMQYNTTANGLGTWFLDKTTGYNAEVARGPITKIAKSLYKEFDEGFKMLDKTGDKTSLRKAISNFKIKIKDKSQDIFVIHGEDLWKNAITEGVEEVSEEAIQDTIKGIVDTFSYLGFTNSQGSFGGWSNVFSKEGLERYLSTFVGGAVGGALFETNRKYIEPFLSGQPIINKTDYDIIEALVNGRENEIITELKNMKKIFNSKQSPLPTDIDGKSIFKSAPEAESQSEIIIQNAINKVGAIKYLLMQKLNPQDLELDFFKNWGVKKFAEVFRNSGFDEKYLKKNWINAISNYAEAKSNYERLKSEKDVDSDVLAKAKERLEETSSVIDGFYSGKNYTDYVLDGTILFNLDLRSSLLNLDKKTYTKNVYGVDYDSLSDSSNTSDITKEKIDEEYDNFIKNELSGDDLITSLPQARKVLLTLMSKMSLPLNDFTQLQHKTEFLSHFDIDLNFNEDIKFSELNTNITNKIKEVDEEIENLEQLISTNVNENGEPLIEETKQELLQKLEELKIKKIELKNQQISLMNTFYVEKITELIKTNPAAFTISDKINFDLAKELESKGFIDLSKFSDKNKDIIRKLINNKAALSRINVWNNETIKLLITTINEEVLKDERFIYVLKMNENNKEDKLDPLVFPEIIFKEDINDSSIESVKIDSLKTYLEDLLNRDVPINNELFKIFLNYFANQINFTENLNRMEGYEEIVPLLRNISKESLLDAILSKDYNSILNKINKPEYQDDIINLLKDFYYENIEGLYNEDEDFYNKLKQKVKINPLSGILKNIYFQLNGSSLGSDIFDYFDKTELTLQDVNKLESFLLTDKAEELLLNFENTLNVVKTVLEAMSYSESSDLLGLTNLMRGYIESYLSDQNQLNDYNVISTEDKELVFKYLESIYNKIDLIKNISKNTLFNKTRENAKLREDYNIGLSLIYNLGIKVTIDGETITLLEEDKFSLDSILDNQELLAYYINTKETELYNKFQELKIKYKSEFIDKIIDALIELEGPEVFNFSEDISDYFKISNKKLIEHNKNFLTKRLITLFDYSPSEFLLEWNEILQNNENIYPKIDQEIALREIFAYLKNPKYFDRFNEKLIEKYNGLEGLKYRIFEPNLIKITGSAGSGKTFISNLFKDKLEKLGYKIQASAISPKKVSDLKIGLNLEEDSAKTIQEMFPHMSSLSKIFNDNIHKVIQNILDHVGKDKKELEQGITLIPSEPDSKTDKFRIDFKQFTKSDEDFVLSVEISIFKNSDNALEYVKLVDYKTTDAIDSKRAIIIDESTLLNPIFIQMLAREAKNKNSTVLLLGDDFQISYTMNIGNLKQSFSINNLLGLDVAILHGSFRANNSGKHFNINSMQNVKRNNPDIFSSYKDSLYTPEVDTKLKAEIANIEFIYKEDGILLGDKISENKDDFLATIKKMLQNTDKSLAVIYENDSDKKVIEDLIKSINPEANVDLIQIQNVDFFKPEDIQGAEYNYTIIYNILKSRFNLNTDNEFTLANTLLTRSKDFSLVYEESDSGLFKNLGLSSRTDNTITELSNNTSFNMFNQLVRKINEKILESLKPVELEDLEKLSETEKIKKPEDDEKKLIDDNKAIQEESKIIEEEKKEINRIENKSDFFGEGSSILYTYYTRLGIGKNRNLDKLDGLLIDLKGFAYANNRNSISSNDIEDFISLKNKLVSDLDSANLDSGDYFIGFKKYDDEIDHPYNKLNDDTEKSKLQQVLIVLMKKEKINGNDVYITLGLIGKSDLNKNVLGITKDNISDSFQLIEITTNKDLKETHNESKRKWLSGTTVLNTEGSLIRYTSLYSFESDYLLNSVHNNDDPEAVINNPNRLKLSLLLSKGFNVTLITFKNKKEFLKEYNSHRIFALEDLSKIENLWNKPWAIITPIGLNENLKLFSNMVLLDKLINIYDGDSINGEIKTQKGKGIIKHYIKEIYYSYLKNSNQLKKEDGSEIKISDIDEIKLPNNKSYKLSELYDKNNKISDSNKYHTFMIDFLKFLLDKDTKEILGEDFKVFKFNESKDLTTSDLENLYTKFIYETPRFLIDWGYIIPKPKEDPKIEKIITEPPKLSPKLAVTKKSKFRLNIDNKNNTGNIELIKNKFKLIISILEGAKGENNQDSSTLDDIRYLYSNYFENYLETEEDAVFTIINLIMNDTEKNKDGIKEKFNKYSNLEEIKQLGVRQVSFNTFRNLFKLLLNNNENAPRYFNNILSKINVEEDNNTSSEICK